MKKLLSSLSVAAVMATSAMAFNFQWKNQHIKSVNLVAEHINIKNSGIKSGTIFGAKIVNRAKEWGNWGYRGEMALYYGKLDVEDSNDKATYGEYSIGFGPAYYFSNLPLNVYLVGKVGYAGVSGDGSSNGGVFGADIGAEYNIGKHFVIGVEGGIARTILDGTGFTTPSVAGYLGYVF